MKLSVLTHKMTTYFSNINKLFSLNKERFHYQLFNREGIHLDDVIEGDLRTAVRSEEFPKALDHRREHTGNRSKTGDNTENTLILYTSPIQEVVIY